MTPTAPQFDLDALNEKFASAHPREIICWCLTNIPNGQLVQTSAFNVDDLIITDLIYRDLQASVPVIFLDTLYHFPETLELVEKAKEVYHLNLKVYKTTQANNRDEFVQQFGNKLWETDVAKFHDVTKIEPLHRGLDELNAIAWITGRRRDQAPTRAKMPVFELDKKGRLKVNPIAFWTRKDSWKYVHEHNVIYNPLHDQGYASIGDEPLTSPVKAGEDERAGRWRGSDKTECGIHL
jgi:phosphoadenosine phosphosulfate reductase